MQENWWNKYVGMASKNDSNKALSLCSGTKINDENYVTPHPFLTQRGLINTEKWM